MSKIVVCGDDMNAVADKFVKGLSFGDGVVKFNDIEISALNMSTSLNYKGLNVVVKTIQINNDDISVDFQVKGKI